MGLSLLRAAFTKFTTIFQNSQVLFYLLFLTCSILLCVNIYLVFVDSDSFIVLFLENIKKNQRIIRLCAYERKKKQEKKVLHKDRKKLRYAEFFTNTMTLTK